MAIRYVKENRWGEVYRPVLKPLLCSILASFRQTVPLPLVPATWMYWQGYSWGFPRYYHSDDKYQHHRVVIGSGLGALAVFSGISQHHA